MKKDIVEILLTIIVIVTLIIIIFMLLLKIIGEGPTALDILTTIVISLLLNTIRTEYSRGKFEGQFRSFAQHTKESFVRFKEDITFIKKEVKELREKKKK